MRSLRLVKDEYDDEGSYIPSHRFSERMEQPDELAERQAEESFAYIDRVRGGKYLRLSWSDLDRITGPILPGWLVAIGGRGKAGKTTFLRELFTDWIEMGKTVVYVGTETQASVLRWAWAATRLSVSLEAAFDPHCPDELYQRLKADVRTQSQGMMAYRAIFGDCQSATLGDLMHWVEYARVGKADALIFDHLHRMDVGAKDQWQGYGSAVRSIKNMAKDSGLTVFMGAQLTQGEGGSWLGEHEIPGNGSWAATANIQRECDVGIQLWRPFKPGITAEMKRAARDDQHKVEELIQSNVMAVRVAAHRWKGTAINKGCKLYVAEDRITSWSSR